MIVLGAKALGLRKTARRRKARAKVLVAEAARLRRDARLLFKEARRWERINANLQIKTGMAA